MDTMKYIELAKSKDTSRLALTKIYRDETHLVATDGHRLHYCNGMPLVEPHFLDGTKDISFPDWKRILPKDSKVAFELNQVEALKVITFLEYLKKIKASYVKFSQGATPQNLVLSYEEKGLIHISLDILLDKCLLDFEAFGISPTFLIDALVPIKKEPKEIVTFLLSCPSSPIEINFEKFKGIALIMRMEFN
jgi:DNA polymerase III sliding clamp (beta) subunit (PCNA family)